MLGIPLMLLERLTTLLRRPISKMGKVLIYIPLLLLIDMATLLLLVIRVVTLLKILLLVVGVATPLKVLLLIRLLLLLVVGMATLLKLNLRRWFISLIMSGRMIIPLLPRSTTNRGKFRLII